MAANPNKIVETYLKSAMLQLEEDLPEQTSIRGTRPVKVLEPGDSVSRSSNPVVPQRRQEAVPDAIKPVARPEIKPPRSKPEVSKEWSSDKKREKMRDYMSEYRGTGAINERKPQ